MHDPAPLNASSEPSLPAQRAAEAARLAGFADDDRQTKFLARIIDQYSGISDLFAAAEDALAQLENVSKRRMTAFQAANVPRAVAKLRAAIASARGEQ